MFLCGNCGEPNEAGAEFCVSCEVYLAWDQVSAAAAPGAVTRVPTTTMPAVQRRTPIDRFDDATTQRPVVRRSTGPVVQQPVVEQPVVEQIAAEPTVPLRVDGPSEAVTVPLDGAPAQLRLRLTNTSAIVEGYRIDLLQAPDWLQLRAEPVNLLPRTDADVDVLLLIVSTRLVPAQDVTVILRLSALADRSSFRELPVTVRVPVRAVPVTLLVEPSLIRVSDTGRAGARVRIDNTRSNRPASVRLSGSDPELAVQFRFEPSALEVPAGQSSFAELRLTAPEPPPGQPVSRNLTVLASDDAGTSEARLTWQQQTTPRQEDPPVGLTAARSLVRVLDSDTVSTELTVDNRGGREWAQVRLAVRDPEGVVSASLSETVVQVPPGGVSTVQLQLHAPLPEPGGESSRGIEISATDRRRRTTTTTITLVQRSSASAMTTLGLQLSPSVVRTAARKAQVTAIVDNRQGTRPARVALFASDPENQIRFRIAPAQLEIPPGGAGQVVLTLSAPPPGAEREVNRPFTIGVSDGRARVQAEGTLIQSGTDRRPWLRASLTLAGALAVAWAAFLPLWAGFRTRAVDLDVNTLAQLFARQTVRLGGFERTISVGLLLMVLAGLMALGLTGAKGRLSKFAAVLIVLSVVALLVAVKLFGGSAALGVGVFVALGGAVLGYIGGLLVKR